MLKKILIANRGEIACRVIRTAKSMGIATVAVYSDSDSRSQHVLDADESFSLGGNTAAESYLDIDKIMDAIKSTGADSVHPGYGFLSENPEFANRLSKENICFIGPSVHAIEAMGDKISSKALASDAGVSTIPGHMDLIADTKEAIKISNQIGYPVMIKASAGGGGKGMRIAWSDSDVEQGYPAARNEASNSFGDDRIFIEKFITRPRHIEIQILSDTHGNCIYLGERECSVQRRNQKVIEEAPSSFVDAKLRKAMGEQAVMLSQAVNYTSAGTVEFVVDEHKNFYFLEMNTRLQVEHPVTELITGLDLVEQMIRIASGEPLSITQNDININGWAFECRLYAEDPSRNFLPSTGRLTRYRPPEESLVNDTILRNDTGVYEGGEISIHYDPMIAKLCVWGKTREQSMEAMRSALDRFQISGISHNLSFLSAVLDHKNFISGDITTAFLEEEYPDGFQGVELSQATKTKLAMSAVALDREFGNIHEKSVVLLDEENFIFDSLKVEIDWQRGSPLLFARFDSETLAIKLDITDFGYRFTYRGAQHDIRVFSPRLSELNSLMPIKVVADTSHTLLCPMPGLVLSLQVEEGDTVELGQPLVILEAMKMENILTSPRKGIVSKINFAQGDTVNPDDIILEFEI